MHNPRIIGSLLLFLIFLGTCSAMSISAETNIPAGTQWSATVNYSLPSGADLRIYLDDALVLSAFEHSGVYVNDQQKSDQVLGYNVYSGKIIVSFAGLSEGDKVLSAKIFSGDSLVDSTAFAITFFRPLSYSEREELNSRLSAMQSTINNQNQTISQLQQDLNAKQEQISKLRQANTDMINSLGQITGEVSSLQESDKSKQESLSKIGSDLNELTRTKTVENAVIGGLFTLGTPQGLATGAIFFVALIIVLGVVIYASNKRKKLYN